MTDATNDLFRDDPRKQEELAASLAAQRNERAEKEFRQWNRTKQLEARKQRRKLREEAQKKLDEEKKSAAASRKRYAQWKRLHPVKGKHKYFSAAKNKVVEVPKRGKVKARVPWTKDQLGKVRRVLLFILLALAIHESQIAVFPGRISRGRPDGRVMNGN